MPALGHWSRWPPRAAVRQRAMAFSTLICDQCSQRRLLSRKPAPQARIMSATSRGGRFIFPARFTLPRTVAR